jgi:hypothetical protein
MDVLTSNHCHTAFWNGRLKCSIAFLAVLLLPGCGSKLDTYPVRGKVHFPDGSPLPGGVVIFISKTTGTPARAKIQDDGTFELGTLSKRDGSVAGLHKVAVRPKMRSPEAPPEHPILMKYYQADTSGLEFDVRTDAPNEFDIEVEPLKVSTQALTLPDK